jgi:GDP-L-fucose synthase
LTGFQGKIVWDPTKSNGQPRRKLDTTRAFHEFGFQVQTIFIDGLSTTIKWHQELRKNAEIIKPGIDA